MIETELSSIKKVSVKKKTTHSNILDLEKLILNEPWHFLTENFLQEMLYYEQFPCKTIIYLTSCSLPLYNLLNRAWVLKCYILFFSKNIVNGGYLLPGLIMELVYNSYVCLCLGKNYKGK